MSDAVRLLTMARVLRQRANALVQRVPEPSAAQIRHAEKQTADAETLLHKPRADTATLERAESLLESATDTLDLIERAYPQT